MSSNNSTTKRKILKGKKSVSGGRVPLEETRGMYIFWAEQMRNGLSKEEIARLHLKKTGVSITPQHIANMATQFLSPSTTVNKVPHNPFNLAKWRQPDIGDYEMLAAYAAAVSLPDLETDDVQAPTVSIDDQVYADQKLEEEELVRMQQDVLSENSNSEEREQVDIIDVTPIKEGDNSLAALEGQAPELPDNMVMVPRALKPVLSSVKGGVLTSRAIRKHPALYAAGGALLLAPFTAFSLPAVLMGYVMLKTVGATTRIPKVGKKLDPRRLFGNYLKLNTNSVPTPKKSKDVVHMKSWFSTLFEKVPANKPLPRHI